MVKQLKSLNKRKQQKQLTDTGVQAGKQKVRNKGKYVKKIQMFPKKSQNFISRIFNKIRSFFSKQQQKPNIQVKNTQVQTQISNISQKKRGRPKKPIEQKVERNEPLYSLFLQQNSQIAIVECDFQLMMKSDSYQRQQSFDPFRLEEEEEEEEEEQYD